MVCDPEPVALSSRLREPNKIVEDPWLASSEVACFIVFSTMTMNSPDRHSYSRNSQQTAVLTVSDTCRSQARKIRWHTGHPSNATYPVPTV